jgi:mannitol/fructose-specific phosphotransferase system IIA component (Ntr-type)/transcriptional antiterminator
MNTINQFLEENQFPAIYVKRGVGMKLSLQQKKKGEILKKFDLEMETSYLSPSERLLFLLFEIADTSSSTLLYELEDKLLISKSTLDEDMRKVRHFLKKYALSVERGNVLSGEEQNIRVMLYDAVNQFGDMEEITKNAHSTNNLIFHFIEKKAFYELEKDYEIFSKKNHQSTPIVVRTQIFLFLSIWFKRLREGNFILEMESRLSRKEELEQFISEECKKFYLPILEREIHYATLILDSFQSQKSIDMLDWGKAQFLAIQLIEEVEKRTGISFSFSDNELYLGLYNHITSLLKRMRNGVQVYNPLRSTIQETYPMIYHAIEEFKGIFEKHTNNKITSDEIAFLTIYFSTSQSRAEQEKKFSYHAVVICNHGVSTGKLLSENLKEQFPISIHAVLSSEDLNIIEKLNVDLLFSTIPLTYPQKPVLVVHPILGEIDKKEINNFLEKHKELKREQEISLNSVSLLHDTLALIEELGIQLSSESVGKVEEIFRKHHLKLNKKEIQPMLKDVLSKKDIQLQKECDDWKEAIRLVAQSLLEAKKVEEKYVDAMIHSVEQYGAYIVIGKHLALAHARPEDGVNQLGISVLTLRKPIPFGNEENDPVKIIFCLAAVDSYSHLNMMKDLVELVDDEEKIEQLAKAQTIEEFQSLIGE